MQWLKSEGITKIAVGYDKDNVYATNGYHSTLNAAPGYGIKVVDSETFETTTTDFSGTVTHVAASGAQAFLTWVTGPAAVILTKTFAGANLGAKTRLVMTTSDATPLYAHPAGAAANGVVMSASPAVIVGDLPSSPLKTEIEKLSVPFAAKYGGQPSEFAADAYSGAEILFAALKKAAPSFSHSDLQAALNHLSVLTPNGRVNFTSSSHSGLNPDDVVMVTVQNGVFQPTPWEKGEYGTLPK
jgi:branched-chain amino acid transport system substrate-binding protein